VSLLSIHPQKTPLGQDRPFIIPPQYHPHKLFRIPPSYPLSFPIQFIQNAGQDASLPIPTSAMLRSPSSQSPSVMQPCSLARNAHQKCKSICRLPSFAFDQLLVIIAGIRPSLRLGSMEIAPSHACPDAFKCLVESSSLLDLLFFIFFTITGGS